MAMKIKRIETGVFTRASTADTSTKTLVNGQLGYEEGADRDGDRKLVLYFDDMRREWPEGVQTQSPFVETHASQAVLSGNPMNLNTPITPSSQVYLGFAYQTGGQLVLINNGSQALSGVGIALQRYIGSSNVTGTDSRLLIAAGAQYLLGSSFSVDTCSHSSGTICCGQFYLDFTVITSSSGGYLFCQQHLTARVF